MVRDLVVFVHADPKGVALARAALERSFAAKVDRRVLEDARLLVSELVTNSVRHAGLRPTDLVRLRAELEEGGGIRVEVCDPGTLGRPRLLEPEPGASPGMGLTLVEQLANRWGTHRDGGTCVWFEVAG